MTDQPASEPHSSLVAKINGQHPTGTRPHSAGQLENETHSPVAGQNAHETQTLLVGTIEEIREQYKQRVDWHNTEKGLTLRMMGTCRRIVGGNKEEGTKLFEEVEKLFNGKNAVHDLAHIALPACGPLFVARAHLRESRMTVEKRLRQLARKLPVWDAWAKDVRGFAELSLAQIIGEAGDLCQYDTTSKVWKRFGLALIEYPDGTRERQQKKRGADAILHGYSPARRSLMWNVENGFIKAGGPYKKLYDRRKVIELERVETKGHAHNRARRFIGKMFLRRLWVAWHDSLGVEVPTLEHGASLET